REAHHGYLSRAHAFEIVPACAGLNFLIAAFLSLCLGLVTSCESALARAALLPASATAAYAATVLANATRLAIAIHLPGAGSAGGWLTPERLHCAVAVAVYSAFLMAISSLATRLAGGRHARAR